MANIGQAFIQAGVPQMLREREQAEREAILAARGYAVPIVIESRGPRSVVAASHKVDSGARAEALGIDRIDAERKLVNLVTRR